MGGRKSHLRPSGVSVPSPCNEERSSKVWRAIEPHGRRHRLRVERSDVLVHARDVHRAVLGLQSDEAVIAFAVGGLWPTDIPSSIMRFTLQPSAEQAEPKRTEVTVRRKFCS
jgi:hypothetical protein